MDGSHSHHPSQVTASSASPAVITNQSSPQDPYNGGLYQVSGGPAALLYTLSNELIVIYEELQQLYSEISKEETSTQAQTINAGATAQEAATKHQAYAIGCDAAGSLIGGFISVGTTVLTAKLNGAQTKNLTAADSKMTQLKSLDSAIQEVKLNNSNGVLKNYPNQENPNTVIRSNELKAGKLNSTSLQNLTPKELQNVNEEAYVRLAQERTPTGRSVQEDIAEKLRGEIASQSREINDIHSHIQTKTTTYQGYSQLANGLATGTAQCLKADQTTKSGSSQAAQQISSGVSQMANTTAETTKQNFSKYYDSVSGVIAAARQGAQAYAQT